MRGRAELQSGIVLLLGSALGLLALSIWGSGLSPTGTGIVFTTHGYASGIIGIMLVGVFGIGALLLLLGAVLWLAQRIRDAKTRRDATL